MDKTKIVSFEREAEFYFELGYKNIQSGRLKTALRYIEKAVKAKPEDAYIQFNYAGLLSELGNIEKSTEVLLNIVRHIDPNYSECYFALGCNFLQLQKVKKAIECLNEYLIKEPFGEFSDESRDLLEVLEMVKQANNNLDDDELEKIYTIEEEAILHLEAREYVEATKKFEEVVKILPKAIPARNNLSLTYYYQGNIEMAIKVAKEVLEYEKENIHANCNLVIFYKKQGNFSLLTKQIKKIRTLKTENYDYLYKIADTFSCVGKHYDAYKVYKKLLNFYDDEDNRQYIHLAAIAAYNSKRFDESITLWKRLKEIDPDNFISDYYIEKAKATIDDEAEYTEMLYMYQLPKEQIVERVEKIYKFISLSKDDAKSLLQSDTQALHILYFGMVFDRQVLRKMIYEKLRKDMIVEAEPIIRKFILRPEVENFIKIESVFLLNKLGAKEPYSIFIDGENKDVTIDPLSLPQSEWKEEWEMVKNKAYEMMKGYYRSPYKEIIEDIWYDFVRNSYPDVPQITRVDIWAAALEYTFCRFYHKEITQAIIASKYGISKSSLSEKYRIIYNILANKLKSID